MKWRHSGVKLNRKGEWRLLKNTCNLLQLLIDIVFKGTHFTNISHRSSHREAESVSRWPGQLRDVAWPDVPIQFLGWQSQPVIFICSFRQKFRYKFNYLVLNLYCIMIKYLQRVCFVIYILFTLSIVNYVGL